MVAPGSDIVLFNGWTATSRGEVIAFVKAITWNLTVNGTSVDVTPYYVPLQQNGKKSWTQEWWYPAGTLGVDATLTIHFDPVLSHPVYDGYGHYPTGSSFPGGLDCTVTTVGYTP